MSTSAVSSLPTTLPGSTPSPTDEVPEGRVRLRLELARMFGNSPVDGAWWPRSRELDVEARQLVDNFPPLRGRIERLAASADDWDDRPTEVQTARGPVAVDRTPADEPHVALLDLTSGRQLRLLVVPASTEQSIAIPMMTRSAASGHNHDAATLLGG